MERTSFSRRLHASGVDATTVHLVLSRVEKTLFRFSVSRGPIAGIATVAPPARQGDDVTVNVAFLSGRTKGGCLEQSPEQIQHPRHVCKPFFVSVTVSGLTILGVAQRYSRFSLETH